MKKFVGNFLLARLMLKLVGKRAAVRFHLSSKAGYIPHVTIETVPPELQVYLQETIWNHGL